MILMGVIYIFIGLLGICTSIVLYQKSKANLSYFKSEKRETQGDFCLIIGVVALLAGIISLIMEILLQFKLI